MFIEVLADFCAGKAAESYEAVIASMPKNENEARAHGKIIAAHDVSNIMKGIKENAKRGFVLVIPSFDFHKWPYAPVAFNAYTLVISQVFTTNGFRVEVLSKTLSRYAPESAQQYAMRISWSNFWDSTR